MPVPIPGDTLEGIADGFEPLPKGTYDAEVTDCSDETAGEEAKHPGSTYIKWEFTITEEEYVGRKVWLNTSLTEKALPVFKGVLRGLGYTDEEMNAMSEFDPDEQLGRQCRVVVTIGKNPKTDEANNSVRRVLPLSDEASELPS